MKHDDNTKDGLHLTVTPDGLVSLWDDERTATRSAKNEAYLLLPLTDEQRRLLTGARVRAAFLDKPEGHRG